MITLTRTSVHHYEAKINGSRWSVTKIASGQWGVARDLTVVDVVSGFRVARDLVESTVIAEQNTAQDAATEAGHVACYNLACLTAEGPECTCTCVGAGHGLAFTGLVKF